MINADEFLNWLESVAFRGSIEEIELFFRIQDWIEKHKEGEK